MGTEVAAVVDLRALTQSDLVALAAASPYAVDPRRGRRRDGDFLPPPKIDRAVFNESAGSRKQTFSRHRVASNSSHNLTLTTDAAAASSAAASPSEEDSENRLIVFHLQRLFARDDPSYPPPPPIAPRPQTLTAPAVAPPAAAPALPTAPLPPAADPDREILNPKGLAVDLARLAELVDPYGEELKKRTEGMIAESELLGFMNALDGQWGSRRRRRKFVDAGMFGDHLPRGWKLLLGLKRKERVAWINCRRYVSPKGHQFATCKEVSSYLMSLLGYVEAKPSALQSISAGVHGLDVVSSAGVHQQTFSSMEMQISVPVTLFSHSGNSHQQNLQKDETRIEANAKECRKCNLTFQDQSAYVQHQLSFHQRKAKRRKVCKSGEPGASTDVKFENQECQKMTEEKRDNFCHGAADARYQDQNPSLVAVPQQEREPSTGEPASGKPLPEMASFPGQEKEPADGEAVFGHQKEPLKDVTGVSGMEVAPAAGEPASGHHLDPVDNSNDHNTHDGACDAAVASPSIDAESKFSNHKSTNIPENDNQKDLKLSKEDNSEKFNKFDETFGLQKEGSPAVDDSDESKSSDYQECTDTRQSEQVSEPCDPLHGKFGTSEGNDLKMHLESNPLSSSRDEPDLNSMGMDVDDGNITHNVDNSTIFKSDKPVTDNIMDCEKVKGGVKIRDVNLNSCLDTISSPVSGGNCETSSTPDDAMRSSIIAQCFGTSSNDENACKDGNFPNQNSACKGENFDNQKNDMVYQSNLTMGPIPPAQINVDCFNSSCSMNPGIKNYGSRDEDGKEALVNSQNMASNEGFDVEAYNNDIFNSTITESSLAQLNNAINMKNDFASCYSISELNSLTGGTGNDEIDIHGMRSTFVSSTSRNEANEHCTLDFDIKGSMLEALEKSDSDLENQYNGAGPSCDSLPAAGTSGNIDDFMSMQTNFGSFTSLVRAVEDVPLSRIIQDQCDLQLGFGGPKQPMYPSFEQQLRMASAGAPPYGNISRHDAVHVPEPTLMLGYAPQLGSCPPPFQLGWGPPYSKMAGGCLLQSVCVWCNTQFQHFGTMADQQADSLGYICPSCKGKFSGHLGINGPSI